MQIVIAGGTGFLGVALAETYAEEGHDVRVLTRTLRPGDSRHDPGTGVPGVTRVGWHPDGQVGPWAAVIRRRRRGDQPRRRRPWRRRAGRRSERRSFTTAGFFRRAASRPPSRRLALRPPVFISASGVGYYGAAERDPKTESSPAGNDFLAQLCQAWEAEASRAQSAATRVVFVRSGCRARAERRRPSAA